MRVRWVYELARQSEDAPDDSNAPLHWDGQAVLVPISRFEHDRETRGKDPSARGCVLDVHRVSLDGNAARTELRTSSTLIAQHWSFLKVGERLLLHVGPFYSLPDGKKLAEVPVVEAGNVGRGLFLQRQGRVFFADGKRDKLYSYDFTHEICHFTLDLKGSKPYPIGPIAFFGDQLICYGRDALNYIDWASGTITRHQTLPRIDKLYPPVEYEGDLLFAYTNWSSGGLLRVDPVTNKPRWKFTTRGGGAVPRGGPLPVVGDIAVLSVNDGSSLIGVDLETGKARWTYRAQWLYTPIEVDGASIIFGTAGGYGRHLRRHNAQTGETEWEVPMKGGCPYYARQGEYLVAGDWGGVLRRIRKGNGQVVDELSLGAPITTAPLVVNRDLFVLKWPTDGTAPALIAVETEP